MASSLARTEASVGRGIQTYCRRPSLQTSVDAESLIAISSKPSCNALAR